jgi:hypothetical protein
VELIDRYSNGQSATGFRFERTDGAGERIGRAEFGWQMVGGEWQLAGEAAFNRLDRVSSLFSLDADGTFQPVPFPAGTGGVKEQRFEGSLTFSRQLTAALAMQATAGPNTPGSSRPASPPTPAASSGPRAQCRSLGNRRTT